LFTGGNDERRAMKTNEILEDIYRVRDEHARECDYDVDIMFARMNEQLERIEGSRLESGFAAAASAAGNFLCASR